MRKLASPPAAAQNAAIPPNRSGASIVVSVVASPIVEVENRTSALLRTLVLCDLVDSTALVERLGDRLGAELIRKHDRLARTIADRHGGQEIDKTDGFLMMFDRPIQAVAFALDYQRGLKQLNAAEGSTLSARVGIHVGDVVVWDNSAEDIARGAKPIEVEGLVKPITSRLMSLALPGQILLSNIAYALAHRAQGELGIQLEKVRWRTHGRYRFRGIPDPVPVFEVGEEGVAPLKAPPWSSKAHREVPFWRRPATVVIEALVVAALIAIPIYMFVRPEPAIAFANRDWVVVGSLQNLTGETVFDDALESALRIGLEQSRYVNVLPDLKVRDTVKRMERDPDTTKVDRAIGSEVAIRDGARALILPTIAEIGGRVRITAEVIDPQTQTTVYSESVDGTGAESVLPSLDTINNRLRVRLGEALATVSSESRPLEKVATKNLDALRAYSLGSRSYGRGEFDKALQFFRQALVLDQSFASAHVRMGAIYMSSVNAPAAEKAFDSALASRERLSARDALYTEVMLATIRAPRSSLQKWSMLAETYPDYFPGTGGYAYASWLNGNRFDDATLGAAKTSASLQNPAPVPSLHLVGILHLGRGEYDEAQQAFARAESMGLVRTEYHSATYAAQRQLGLALETIAQSPMDGPTVNPVVNAARNMFEASYALDGGKFADAVAKIAIARSSAPARSTTAIYYSVAALTISRDDNSGTRYRFELEKVIGDVIELRSGIADAELSRLDAVALVLAYLAANAGHLDVADKALAIGERNPAIDQDMTLSKLRTIAKAERQRSSGDAKAAIAELKVALDGSELYITHLALLDAYVSAGESRNAAVEARWLATHRGRAYAEFNAMNLLTAFNAEQSTIALLRGAELEQANGDSMESHRLLDEFEKVWPKLDVRPSLQRRASELRSQSLPPREP
jgi:putative peptide modification system cyclase